MKILTMIPARMGSNRIKKKNLRILGDIPLIEHIIRSAKDSYYTSEIFINSGLHIFGEMISDMDISLLKTRAGYLRMVVIGLLLQYILQKYPEGIMPESRPVQTGERL